MTLKNDTQCKEEQLRGQWQISCVLRQTILAFFALMSFVVLAHFNYRLDCIEEVDQSLIYCSAGNIPRI
jgi:hypothetical protein